MNIHTLNDAMEHDNFVFYEKDIRTREEIKEIFENEHPDMIVNFAAKSQMLAPSSLSGFRDTICVRIFLPRVRERGRPQSRCREEGGAVYAVSARGPAAGQAAGSVIAIRSGRSWTAAGFGPPRRMAPPYVGKFNI